MAKFGLDNLFITKFKKQLSVEYVINDQNSDFFLLPQFNAIYKYRGERLKEIVAAKLGKSDFGPRPAIEMEVPKASRVGAKSLSLLGPNYFRPGSVPFPDDRLVYHFLAQQAETEIESSINRKRVFSNKPLEEKGSGFVPQSIQWTSLKSALENEVKSGKYKVALKCDLSQYFFSINQHEMVNQLEHQGVPPEIVKLSENFLSGLTLDRSSRGILQGVYASDLLGNGYLVGVDEFISDSGHMHFRYVDDIYILFETTEGFRTFFPRLVKKLRDYDLSLNESKTFAVSPLKLLKEETELDQALKEAKEEAQEKLTDYEEIEVEVGPYGETVTDILENAPDHEQVELEATLAVFKKIDDFQGEERHRAESFCLNFFRRAVDPIAIDYVAKRWLRHPHQAKEYVLYLNRFVQDPKHCVQIDKMLVSSASDMIDYQWAWAAMVMRRMPKMSSELLAISVKLQRDGSQHEVVRSLLTYTVCKNGSAQRKKEVRDAYATSPLLVQLAIIHCGSSFTSGERSALMKSAEAHGELHALMCEAFKQEQKDNAGG